MTLPRPLPPATSCATHVVHGDAENAQAEVVVAGEYEIGMQDQAFLGPNPGSPSPMAREA